MNLSINLKGYLYMAVFCFFSQIGCSHGQEAASARDNSIPETISFIIHSPTITQKEYDNTSAKIREFIWKHWRTKTPGRLFLESTSKEGSVIKSIYDINLLPDGTSIISVLQETDTVNYHTRERQKGSSSYVVKELDRIEPPTDRLNPVKTIPVDLNLPAHSFRLRLKDSDGVVLHEL